MNDISKPSIAEASAGIYTDFAGLAKLRSQAAQQSPEATKEVAQQFESFFLQIMLKSMRDASQMGESTDGEQTRFYQDMFDKQVALDLASGNGIGLAAILQRQLGASSSDDMTGDSVPETQSATDLNWRPESEQSFIQDLWPEANRVAQKLGVATEVVIAQSALETNWGQEIITNLNGQKSLNLFGIKADNKWEGGSISISTLEYRDGIAQQERASFRSYASLSESMDDYVSFLQNNPRYQQALENTADTNSFLHELQQAGYASDPAYAEKINSIMNRNSFMQTVEDLRTLNELSELE